MSYVLTEKLRKLVPYQPIEGDFPIRLDANESFLPLEESVKKQVLQALAEVEFNRYPDPYCRKVCQAFADYYQIPPDFVTAGNGSDELISILLNTFFKRGDKLLTVSPDFSMYQFYADLAELEVITYQKEKDFSIDIDKVIAIIHQKNISGVIFSNPCNPTSKGLDIDSIRKLIASVNSLVIIDEAYMDFWDKSILPYVGEYDNLVVLRTCSKAIGLAALRLGFAVASHSITQAIRAAKSPYNVNSFTQISAEIVLKNTEYIQQCIRQLMASREYLYRELIQLQQTNSAILKVWKPDTNFVYFQTSENQEIYEALLRNGIAIRNMKEYLRVTAGSPEENAAFINALSNIMDREEG